MLLLPWRDGPTAPAAEVKDSELEVKTDAATGKATVPMTLQKGGIYRLRTAGTDRFGQTGDQPDLYHAYRLDADAIIDAAAELLLGD